MLSSSRRIRSTCCAIALLLQIVPLTTLVAQSRADSELAPFAVPSPHAASTDAPRRFVHTPPTLAQGTTDVALGFAISLEPSLGYADTTSVRDRLATMDASVVHRFRAHGVFRVAAEPVGIRRTWSGDPTPVLRASVLAGRSGDVVRTMAGASAFRFESENDGGRLAWNGGVQALVRVELGRPFGAHATIQGGLGWASLAPSSGTGAEHGAGFSGEMSVQLPFRTRGREFAGVRLVTRWFGALGALCAEAGLDVVVGHRFVGKRPTFTFGYRWTAFWGEPQTSRHGVRLAAEWYGLGR